MRLTLSLLLFAILNLHGQEMNFKNLKRDIKQELSRSPGTFAIAFQDLSGKKKRLFINEKEHFHAASTMKTPVLLEVYKQAAAGKFKLTDSLMVKNEFKSIVDGSPFSLELSDDSEPKLYQKLGQKVSIYDLCYDMIIFSSNLATNTVIELVGAASVTQAMRDLGAMDIQVRRGVEDNKAFEKGLNNTTTAYDLMLLFEKIGKLQILNVDACDAMIDILLDQKFNEVIPAKLPKAVKVAHKTGWITKVRHDSGIVMLPDGRKYVLVLLSKGWESDELATEIMANVSKSVYEYYISEN